MRNSIAETVTAVSGEETTCLCPGIQFDDNNLSPEERRLEATRQLIWEKLVARLRSEFPVKKL